MAPTSAPQQIKSSPVSAANPGTSSNAIETMASEKAPGIVGEFWMFLTENKKWWLLPIVIVLGLVGVLAVLSSTAAAPFIYTLF